VRWEQEIQLMALPSGGGGEAGDMCNRWQFEAMKATSNNTEMWRGIEEE
jgi:hypothetical protein